MFEGIGKESVERLERIVDKIPTVVRDIELHFFGGLHGLLDRIDVDLHFRISPPKAKPVNPPPEQDKIY